MHRRNLLASLIALIFPSRKQNDDGPVTEYRNRLPVIRFFNPVVVANGEDLFKGISWEERTVTSGPSRLVKYQYRETMAYLPFDRAMYILGEKTRDFVFGPVKVEQTLGEDFNTYIMKRTDQSHVVTLKHPPLIFGQHFE